jgi:hypothetical protein
MASKGLSDKDLEEARQRAISAGLLPDGVRRELLILFQRQDALPKDLRKLAVEILRPSGWVISHLIPKLAKQQAGLLRQNDTEASYKMSAKLEVVSDLISTEPRRGIDLLLQPSQAGKGSRSAGQANSAVLRILDLGLVGLPLPASVYAKSLGLLDTSVVLVSDGHLQVHQAIEATKKLGDEVLGYQTEVDKKGADNSWLAIELFSPKDFDSTRVESIPARRK